MNNLRFIFKGDCSFFVLGLTNPSDLENDSLASCSKGSLFDNESAENKGTPTIYIFDELKHADVYSESYALGRYGAFWLDYMFTANERTSTEGNLLGELSTVLTFNLYLMVLQ